MRRWLSAARFVIVFATALAAGCAKSGDPIRASIDRMVEAANGRDAAGVMKLVAADFQAADGSSRADSEVTLRRYFAAYESLHVAIRDVQIERGENAARVRFRAEMSGQPFKVGGLSDLLPSAASYDFDLRMTLDGKTWKIAWASWNQAQ